MKAPLFSLAPHVVALFTLAACGADAPPPVAPSPQQDASDAGPQISSVPESPPADIAPRLRLPNDTRPTAESLELHVDPARARFSGIVDIQVTLDLPRTTIWLHGQGLHVTRATATPDGGGAIDGAWSQRDDTGLAQITLPSALPAGRAKLHIEYDAPFGPPLEGLHKITQAGIPYAFTQFEAITAREAFPCFDEPGFKVPFDTTLVVPRGDEAIANTKEASRSAEGSSLRVRFAPTLPIPSYLVAFAVGPLEIVAAPDVPPNAVRARPLPLRGVTTKGHGKEIAYALAHTGEILAAHERYFGIEYPYDKLDIIAVPDKGGAMENPGAVTFADSLLLFDEKTAPLYQKRQYALTMAHELAHQWVGDLVTAAFWDDIWLNEAFAEWAQGRAADAFDPSLNSRLELLESVESAVDRDSLAGARAIRQPIESTNDIQNAFDEITYDKGGGVLSMFERWIGAETFQRGLHEYLQAHRFANATADDFLDAESSAAGKDVKTPFHTFLDRPGVPFVVAQVKCDGSPRLHLTQSRYLPLGSTGDGSLLWQIPICARYQVGKESKESCALLKDREGDLPLGETCPDWVFPNADAAGYYRFALAPDDLRHLQKSGLSALSPRELVAYADSLRAAYGRGVLPMKDALTAIAPLARDPHRAVAHAPMALLEEARNWLYDDPSRAAVESYARSVYQASYANLGWQPSPGDTQDRLQLRRDVVWFMAATGRDPRARAEAKKRGLAFLGYKGDLAIHPDVVDANLVGLTMSVVGEDADKPLWDHVRAQLGKTEDTVLRRRLLFALSSARTPKLALAALELSFDPGLRSTETLLPLATELRDHETREAAWAWEKASFDKLLAVTPKEFFQPELIQLTNVFCDEAHAKDVATFFTAERASRIEGGPRVLATTLEEIHLCAVRREKQEPSARAQFARLNRASTR